MIELEFKLLVLNLPFYLSIFNVEISQKLGLLPIKGKSETIWHVDRGGNLLGDKNYMERQAQ